MLKCIKMHENADVGSAVRHLGHSAFPLVSWLSRSSRSLTSDFAHKQIESVPEKWKQQRGWSRQQANAVG